MAKCHCFISCCSFLPHSFDHDWCITAQGIHWEQMDVASEFRKTYRYQKRHLAMAGLFGLGNCRGFCFISYAVGMDDTKPLHRHWWLKYL